MSLFASFFKKKNINIEIKRSLNRKKTITIQIRNGSIRALSPYMTSDAQIEKLLYRNNDWINLKLKSYYKTKKKYEIFDKLKKVLFKGKKYDLNFFLLNNRIFEGLQQNKIAILVKNNSFEEKKRKLEKWLFTQAKSYLKSRTYKIAENHFLKFNNVSIRNYKSRWGSCDNKSNISLNWKLIMLPSKITDYVIIHELCHTKYMDHSLSFWKLVSRLDHEYKHNRENLKDFGYFNSIF
tara:strand:+ start:479 stop:1189 length:711 start_codon:yes stop_codon:yes gene_type:complete